MVAELPKDCIDGTNICGIGGELRDEVGESW
jgi:hypothetical protein